MEYLDTILKQLVETIEDAFLPPFTLGEAETYVMASIDILITLCQTYDETPFVDEEVVARWKKAYLQKFDATDSLWGPDDQVERRKIILETFAKLEKLAFDNPY